MIQNMRGSRRVKLQKSPYLNGLVALKDDQQQ